jgi:hypothetical protein
MKALLKIVGGLIVCLLLLLLVLRFTGYEPHDLKPGLWLKGDLVTTPVADWSFVDQHQMIEVETFPWYGIPHSVITGCISYNGSLYLTSAYPAGVQFPSRYWNKIVLRNPHVRIKVGDKLYKGLVSYVVTDPAEHAGVLAAKLKKYPPYGHVHVGKHGPPPGQIEVEFRVLSE